MPKILLMGPTSPPYTGQSVAFTTIVEYYRKNEDFNCIEVNLSNKNGIIKGILLCLSISYQMIFNKIDLIYFTCSRSFLGSLRDVVLLSWAKIFRVKVVNHLHGGDFRIFYNSSSFLYKRILKWCYQGVSSSIVLLDGMKILFENFPRMKVDVVSNSYSLSLDDYPTIKQLSNGPLKFLYLSNIMESKGILNLLDAFEIILNDHLECQLTIAGSYMSDYISSEQEIRQKFELKYYFLKEKYPNKINYVGVVNGKKKSDLLWSSDVFLLPTFHQTEAFPISILEALRTGNYIITTEHNYLPDVVSSQNGRLIKPNSVNALTEVISDVIEFRNKLDDVQNYNINYAVSNFTESQYVKGVTQIINENLNNNSHIQ